MRFLLLFWAGFVPLLLASEHRGLVKFGGLPVPGATVTASQGDKRFSTISEPNGSYSFTELADGTWTIEVEMQCFAPVKKEVVVAAGAPPVEWNLKLIPMPDLKAAAATAAPALSRNSKGPPP